MGVKIEDIKPGDRIRGGWYVVKSVGRYITLVKGEAGEEHRLLTSSIVEHVPAPREIKVGDRVTWGSGDFAYTVLAIVEKRAWVDSDGCPVHLLSSLRHVD